MKTDLALRINVALLAVLTSVAMLGCSSVAKPPVVISVRDSIVNKGKVLKITNTSEAYLHQIQVMVHANERYNSSETTVVVAESLAPHRTIQVGWIELGDRELVAGDTVSIACHNYGQRVSITVPETPRRAAR